MNVARLGIIGGTGLGSLSGLAISSRESVDTPWGSPSGPLNVGQLAGQEIVFLARHGDPHAIPPHKINYRANIWALRELGVSHVIAIASVGGISPGLRPGTLAVPDQIVDYTWGRGHTFFEDDLDQVVHVDFTDPFCAEVRGLLIEGARRADVAVQVGGTYGATQGPRLESKAEIDRLERDGCHMVGMTGMPEAGLARELGLGYAQCAVIVNPAAGRGDGVITMDEIMANVGVGMAQVRKVLEAALALV